MEVSSRKADQFDEVLQGFFSQVAQERRHTDEQLSETLGVATERARKGFERRVEKARSAAIESLQGDAHPVRNRSGLRGFTEGFGCHADVG